MKKLFKSHMIKISIVTLIMLGVMGCASKESTSVATEETGSDAVIEAEEVQETNENVEDTAKITSYPLSITNFSITDGVWSDIEQTFNAAPSRVVANNQSTAELLIHLGLTDTMVGVAALYGETAEELTEEFSKIPVLSNDYVGKEITVGTNPDLVIGRSDLFADAEWGVGTVEQLNELGINTYILNTGKKGATLEALFKDIEELGIIFNVSENATAFSDTLRDRISLLKEKMESVDQPLTYAYASGTDDGIAIYAGTSDTFQNDMLNQIKLDNAFKDATGEINQEQLLSTNPDVILISRYTGGPDPDEIIAKIYDTPAYQTLTAVQNKQIYVIDFSEFWGYSYQIIDGVEKLAAEIYPDLMK